jgi:hypothetical protein
MGGWTLVDDVPVLSYCMVLFADFSVEAAGQFNTTVPH